MARQLNLFSYGLNSGEPYVRKVPVRFGGRGGSRPSLPLSATSKKTPRSHLCRSGRGGRFGEIFRPKTVRRTDHPVRAASVASRLLITAQPPLLFKEGKIQKTPLPM